MSRTRSINVDNLLKTCETADLGSVVALSKGLVEISERRTKATIEDYETKLKALKNGEMPKPENIEKPNRKPRTKKKKDDLDEQEPTLDEVAG